jgi:hypothetical protein
MNLLFQLIVLAFLANNVNSASIYDSLNDDAHDTPPQETAAVAINDFSLNNCLAAAFQTRIDFSTCAV